MSHLIPPIHRRNKLANQNALKIQFWDSLFALNLAYSMSKPYVLYKYPRQDSNLGGITIEKTLQEVPIVAWIDNESQRMTIVRSNIFGGHVFCTESIPAPHYSTYIGTCEEVYFALQDAMYTEAQYAQRTREKVINGKGSQFYSEEQKQIAHKFLKASNAAKDEWFIVLNKLAAVCRELKIDLQVGGHEPKDLIPRALKYK